MFWGKNIKSGETFSFDSDKSILDQDLNITNISLSDGMDNTKYFLKITNNGQTYQLCSLDKNRDSITSSLSFNVKKGMKLSVKGGNKGTVSITGFVEKFKSENKSEVEEINTDNIKEKEEKAPQIKNKNKNEKKEEKEKEKEKKIEKEEEEDENIDDDIGDDDDDDDDGEIDDELNEESDEENEEKEKKQEKKKRRKRKNRRE